MPVRVPAARARESLMCCFVGLCSPLRLPRSHAPFLRRGGFLLAAIVANLLPFMLVERAAFIYHWMPGLL